MLLVVLAAATAVGLYWHFSAQAPDAELASRPVPLSLKVYSEDQEASVDLTLTVSPDNGSGSEADLYLAASTTKDLLITASLPDDTASGRRFTELPRSRTDAAAGRKYVAVVSAPDELRELNRAGVLFASFRLPPGAITHQRGTYAARLLAVGQGESEAISGVAYRSTARADRVEATSLYLGPAVATEADLEAAEADPSAPVRTSFYVPGTLSTSEILLKARDVVAHGDVQLNYPSNGTLEADAFVWRGEFGVSPELTVISREATNRANRDSFLSGVALASAAAALIALVQELPDRWRPLRRRRPEPPA